MAYAPGAMRPPGPPAARPPSLELPPPTEQPAQVPPPPEHTWPCGCAYPGPHITDCMWSLWEQMRSNYLQTKTLMGQFMTQVDSLQTGAKARVECECPSSCHGRDLGQAMGLQQMQGVTVPWLQPAGNMAAFSTNTATVTGVADVGNYVSESRKLVEEQQRVKKTWAQFLNIFDIALDMANDVSRDRWEAARLRKERELLERQERREEERRERQERREKCAEERNKSKDEDEETETQQQQQQRGSDKRTKEKPAEKQQKKESKRSEVKSPPGTPQRRKSTQQSAAKEEQEEPAAVAEAEPEESPQPQPEVTEEADVVEDREPA